jgi:hypothetical protein
MMSRSVMPQKAAIRPLARALVPFLAAQLLVLAAVVAFPALTHLAQPKGFDAPPIDTRIDDDAARKRFNDMLKLPSPD